MADRPDRDDRHDSLVVEGDDADHVLPPLEPDPFTPEPAAPGAKARGALALALLAVVVLLAVVAIYAATH